MDTVTFAQKIKEKYPQYQNTDDITLVNKIIEKYPQYKTQIIDLPKVEAQSTETGADIRQIGTDISATTETALDKFEAAKQRMKTGQQGALRTRLQQLGIGAGYASGVAGDIIKGGVKAVLPQSAEDVVKTGTQKALTPIVQSEPVQNIISKYEQLKQTNPALAQDIDSLLGVGMLALDVTGAGAGAKGATAGIETGISATKTGLKAGKQIAGDIATTGKEALSTATKPLTEAVSGTFNPEQIMQRVARIPKGEQAKFQKLTGESVGQYLTSRNIFGNEEEILTKLYNNFQQSKQTADDALAQLQGTFKPKQIKTALSELVKKEARVSVPGAISKDAKRVTQLLGKYSKEGLNMSEINEVKRLYERNIKVDYLKSAAVNPEKVTLATNIDSAIRDWQMKQAEKLGLQNLSTINKETQAAKSLLDSFGKEVMGSAGNNALGLTDAVLLSGGDPTSIGMLVTKKILSSKGVQSKIAETLSKGKPKKLPVKAVFGKAKQDITDFLTK